MKKIKYILREELTDMGFGKTTIYNVYLKSAFDETFDCTFWNKEKAERYVMAINEGYERR